MADSGSGSGRGFDDVPLPGMPSPSPSPSPAEIDAKLQAEWAAESESPTGQPLPTGTRYRRRKKSGAHTPPGAIPGDGLQRELCGAKSRSGTCQNPAGHGTDHPGYGSCQFHMGNTPSMRGTAKKRMQIDTASRTVASLGLRRDIGPVEAVLEEIQYAAGAVSFLRSRVADLDPDDLTWGKAEERFITASGDKYDGPTHYEVFKAGAHPAYEMYLAERKYLLELCRVAYAGRLAERAQHIQEQQGVLVALTINRILDRLSLTPDQLQQVASVVPAELRALGDSAVEPE
jgi:hypothetical protein